MAGTVSDGLWRGRERQGYDRGCKRRDCDGERRGSVEVPALADGIARVRKKKGDAPDSDLWAHGEQRSTANGLRGAAVVEEISRRGSEGFSGYWREYVS